MIGSSSFPRSSTTTSLSSCPFSRSSKHASKALPQGPSPPQRLDILEQVLTDDKHQILTSNDTAALNHFVTSFIWVDILSRASGLPTSPSSTPLSQPFDYLPLLENNTLDLSRVMGCENWVFIGIAQIVMLESALVAQRAGCDPNALDCASRAAVLEVMFERGVRELLEARARAEMGAGLTKLELQSSLVTELFALAALTYLHVTMSGAYPWLPKVRQSVARAMEALVALPMELLIRVSWPTAVTGCMVLEEKQSVVREVVGKAQKAGINTGTIWKGMVVVEECWRLREERVGDEVSWVHAMESLGEKILLC
jgi:C6 transcription factor Pro1